MDVRDNPTAGDRALDQGVELLIPADRQLEVARGDTLHLQILAGVARQLQNLGSQVLEDRRRVDGRRRSDAAVGGDPRLQLSVDSPNGELEYAQSKILRKYAINKCPDGVNE